MRIWAGISLCVLCSVWSATSDAARIKDIANLYGVRDNSLFGYGIVTGLNRSGDSQRNEATIRALANRLQGLGFTLGTADIKSRNVAVVMVTAKMPSASRPGHLLDVEVSSTGDATSLEGGVLQLTPMYAANGVAYAAAQGPLVIGGFTAEQGGTSTTKNHPTVGRVPQGATIERENPNRLVLSDSRTLEWLIHEPDFTTAQRFVDVINTEIAEGTAIARDAGTVVVTVPEEFAANVVGMVSTLEALELEIDSPARVVINERTGTVVMGAEVKISPVAVAHGGLSIEVERNQTVSQPSPLSAGTTQVVTESQITVEESGGELVVVEGVTIGDLVSALNSMGVKPRDLIQILLTIHAAGDMHAELEVL